MDINNLQQMILLIAMIALGILIVLSIIISIMGPRYTDRLVAVSVVNTEINAFMCILVVYFAKGYIVDVALVYGMISFAAIVILAKLKLKQYLEDNKTTLDEKLKAVSSNDGDN